MKKIFFFIIAICVSTIISAQNFMDLQSGSVLEMKNAGKSKVLVEWNYSKQTLDGKPAKDYFANKSVEVKNEYPNELKDAEGAFEYILPCKYIDTVNKKQFAQYIINIELVNYDYENGFLSCKVKFYRNGNSKPIAVYNVSKIPGVTDCYNNNSQRKNAYILLALNIISTIRNAK